jgi:hypothetical protein
MRHHDSPKEQDMDLVRSEDVLTSCRNHIESLQNLSYLTVLEADSPTQVRLNIRMMEWHIRNLAEVLLSAA